MKLLHVTPSFYPSTTYGGPCFTVHTIAQMMASLGNDVHVLTTDADGAGRLDVRTNVPLAMAKRLSVTYCSRSWGPDFSLNLLRQLPRWIQWADVIVLSGVFCSTTIPVLILSRYFGKPLAWLAHGSLMRTCVAQKHTRKFLWNQACRLICQGAKAFQFVANSAAEKQDCSEIFPDIPSRVIPHAVMIPTELPEWSSPTESDRCLRLLFLGRLHPIKGIDNLIRAVALLRHSNPMLKCEVTIAGAGETDYTSSLRDLAASLGVGAEVRFVGPAYGSMKDGLFRECHVVIVPSHSENFCVVVGESLARARPVIASTGVPWSELERNGCGIQVEGSPERLAKAIVDMSSRDLMAMGLAGRKWVAADFSIERVSLAWSEALATLVRGPVVNHTIDGKITKAA